MKRQMILLGIAFLLSFSVFAQNWVEFNTSESTKPVHTVSISNDTLVKFKVTIPGIYETPVNTFNRIEITEHIRMDSVGFPEVPVVSFLISIPDCDSVNLNIVLLDSIQFSGYNIYPAPELIADTLEGGAITLIEQFAYDTSAYETDAMFPGFFGKTINKGAIREQNVVRVMLYPVQFNPVKNIIKAYSSIEVNITFYNPSGNLQHDVGIFNEVVGNTLINYRSNGLNASVSYVRGLINKGTWKWATNFPNDAIMDTCDYLLITDDYFYYEQASKIYIDSLARHRAEFNGFDVVIVRMKDIEDSIIGINNKERIRNLLKNTYDNGFANNTYDGKLAYVNLFGDVDLWNGQENIPTHYEDPDHGGYDVYYTRLTQTNGQYDTYPDIMLGRCSVDDTTQVKNVVEKILNIEPDEYETKNQCLQFCDDAPVFYTKINEEFGKIKNIIPGDSTFFITPDNFDSAYYHPDWILKKPYELETVLDTYKETLTCFNYLGHGSQSFIGSLEFQFSNLNNDHNDKLPFGFFNTCLSGTFHLYDDCFCEEMINKSRNRGMIATVGANKVIGINVNKSYYMINSLYYNSPVIGSAYLECQLKAPSILTDFNLFGDPALNLFYENIDTLKADIIIQKLFALNNPVKQEDTLKITAIISNLMNMDVDDNFVTSCYLRRVGNPDHELAASITTNGLDAFTHDTLEFKIPANPFVQDFYECRVVVDTAGTVDELSKLNNSADIELTILNINPINIEEPTTSSIVPISYNIQNLEDSNQIVAGTSVFTYEGDIIRNLEQDAVFYSGIGNATSGNVTFINSFNNMGDETTIISYTLDSAWTKTPVSNEIFGQPCVGFIDNTGDDYIFFSDIYYADTNWHYNLTCLDYKCNEIWKLEDFSKVYSINPYLQPAEIFSPACYYDTELNKFRITALTQDGKIFIVEENQLGLPAIEDSVLIDGCRKVLRPLVIGDIGFNKMVKFAVSFYDLNNKYCLALIDAGTLQYDTIQVSNTPIFGPWIYDLDNNGEMEVIISVPGNGFYVYDDQLNQTQVSDSILLKFAGFCDADNDDFPEIIYEVKEGSRYYLTARNILDSVVFKLPLVRNNESYCIADKENNGKVDILLNSNGYLNNIELVEKSKIWSWEGELGNLKINGMYMQPAFYKSNDTVYWSDNISISDTFEIPAGATVIVKPGTHVYAKEDAEFIVFGKLIAKGTEFHPIKFTANIIGAGKSYWGGITAKTNGIVQLEYCQIENAVVGLFLYSSKPANVENNTFKNNRVGLCAYASSPRIIENYFTQNSISIACQASSKPYLVGGTFSNVPYYNGIINNDTAIAMYNSIPSIKNGHNDIYNDTLGIYLVFVNDYPLNKLNVSSNYYGSSDTNTVKSHLCPSSKFIIIPLLNSAQTNFKNLTSDGPEELLGIAYTFQQEQQYESAIQVFEQLIQTFPEANEALFSITGEFECFREGGLSWSEFIVNMDNLLQDTVINTSLEKYASEYKNLALRIDGKYMEAIINYETILKNPVSYYDSLYAIINLSNALLESGRYKSSTILEGIDESLIENDVSHIIRTKELLFSKLKGKSGRLKKEGCVKIERVYPNPTNSSFTTEYTTCHEGITIIDLYSSSGNKVLSKQVNNKPGQNIYYVDNSITPISLLKPGIYLLKVTNNNQFDSQRIIIN